MLGCLPAFRKQQRRPPGAIIASVVQRTDDIFWPGYLLIGTILAAFQIAILWRRSISIVLRVLLPTLSLVFGPLACLLLLLALIARGATRADVR